MANKTNSNVAPRLFAYIAHGCDLTTTLTTKYNNSLIFIGDEKQIYSPAMETYVGIGMTAYTNTLTYAGVLGHMIDNIKTSMDSAIVSHINGQGDAYDLARLNPEDSSIKVFASDGTQITDGSVKKTTLSNAYAFSLSGDVSIRGVNDSNKDNPNLAYNTYLLTFKTETGDKFYVERDVTYTYNGNYASSGINVSTVESTYTYWYKVQDNGKVLTSLSSKDGYKSGIGYIRELVIDDRATWSYIASAYTYTNNFAREWATAEANRIYHNILGDSSEVYIPVSYNYALQVSNGNDDNDTSTVSCIIASDLYYKKPITAAELEAGSVTADGYSYSTVGSAVVVDHAGDKITEEAGKYTVAAGETAYIAFIPTNSATGTDKDLVTAWKWEAVNSTIPTAMLDSETMTIGTNKYPIFYKKESSATTYNTNLADGINTLKEVAYLLDVLTDGLGSFTPTYDQNGNFTGYTATSSDNLGIKMAYSIATTQQEINLSNNRINELESGTNTLRSLSTSNSKYVNIVTESTHRTYTYTSVENGVRSNTRDINLYDENGSSYVHNLGGMMGDSNLTVRLNVANTYITSTYAEKLYVQVPATELVAGKVYYTTTNNTDFTETNPSYDVHKDAGTTWYVKNGLSYASAAINVSYIALLNEEVAALLDLYTANRNTTTDNTSEDEANKKYAALGISGVNSKTAAQSFLNNVYVADGAGGYKLYTSAVSGITQTGEAAIYTDYTTPYILTYTKGLVEGEDYILNSNNEPVAYSVANNSYIYYLDYNYAEHTTQLYYRRDNGGNSGVVEHAELASGLVATTDWVSAYMFQEDQSITDKLQQLKIATYSFAKQVGGAINSVSEGEASQYAFRHVQQSGKVQLMYREMPQDTVSSSTVVYDPTTEYNALGRTVADIAGASLDGKKLYVVDDNGSEYIELTDADYKAIDDAKITPNSISEALGVVDTKHAKAHKVKDSTMVYVYDEAKRKFIDYKQYVQNVAHAENKSDNYELFKDAGASESINDVTIPNTFNIFDTTHAGFVKLYYKGTKFIEVKAETLNIDKDGSVSIKTVDNNAITLGKIGDNNTITLGVNVYTTSTTDKHTDYITTSTKHFSYAVGGKGQNHTDIQLHITKLADADVDNTGLADAYDVRSFIENLCSWVDISATVTQKDDAIGKAARYNPLNTVESLYTQDNAIYVSGSNTQGAEGADHPDNWANRDSRFDGLVNNAPTSGSAATTEEPVTTTTQS